jgi:hypothetical protein
MEVTEALGKREKDGCEEVQEAGSHTDKSSPRGSRPF